MRIQSRLLRILPLASAIVSFVAFEINLRSYLYLGLLLKSLPIAAPLNKKSLAFSEYQLLLTVTENWHQSALIQMSLWAFIFLVCVFVLWRTYRTKKSEAKAADPRPGAPTPPQKAWLVIAYRLVPMLAALGFAYAVFFMLDPGRGNATVPIAIALGLLAVTPLVWVAIPQHRAHPVAVSLVFVGWLSALFIAIVGEWTHFLALNSRMEIALGVAIVLFIVSVYISRGTKRGRMWFSRRVTEVNLDRR